MDGKQRLTVLMLTAQGKICLESLKEDKWLPTINAVTLLQWISDLFSASCTPPSSHDMPRDSFAPFSRDVSRHIASFLSPRDLGKLGSASKTMLAQTQSEPLWASFFYRPNLAPFGLIRLARDLGK